MTAGPTQPGSGSVAATGGTGDGADGIVTVNLSTNAASVSIAASGGTLSDGGANTIPFTDITATDGGTITVPDFGASVNVTPGGVFDLSDSWTYSYDNSTVYAAGTYDGRATYTVTVL